MRTRKARAVKCPHFEATNPLHPKVALLSEFSNGNAGCMRMFLCLECWEKLQVFASSLHVPGVRVPTGVAIEAPKKRTRKRDKA